MKRASAIFGVSLLLSILVVGTVVAAIFYSPPFPSKVTSTSTITATTLSVSTAVNATELTVRLEFPNHTNFEQGLLNVGPVSSNATHGTYNFTKILPGNYSLSLATKETVYLPPTTIVVKSGLNFANITIFVMKIFVLYFTNGLTINGTQPGPLIQVDNETAIRMNIRNNTTLIHNFAVVSSLSNETSQNILFNSLSDTLNAGGSTNQTFVVNKVGTFYYEDLIGSHAQDGEYGYFVVVLP